MHPNEFRLSKAALLLSTTLLLGGCIGSSNNQNPAPLQTGDTFTVTKRVDGHQVMLDTYRILALTDSGQLSSTPVTNDAAQPHFALLESRVLNPVPVVYTISSSANTSGSTTPAILMETTAPFIESLISAYRSYFNGISAQEAVMHLNRLGLSPSEIYIDYSVSGLGSLSDYIAFYTAVDQYGPDSSLMEEADAKRFIDFIRMNQSSFLQLLTKFGLTWPELLTQMKAKAYSFDMLQQAYAHSGESLGNYLAGFVHGGTSNLGGSLTDDNNAASEAAALGYAVNQFSWYNIDPNGVIQTAAHGYWSDVLSAQDPNVFSYNYVHIGDANTIEYVVQNNADGEFDWKTVADVSFTLQYDYGAVSQSVPNSYWLTLLTLNVGKNNVNNGVFYKYVRSLKSTIVGLSDSTSSQGNSVNVTIQSDFHIKYLERFTQQEDYNMDMHYYDNWQINSQSGNYEHSSSDWGNYTCLPTDTRPCQWTVPPNN